MPKRKSAFYGVRRGHTPGVYQDWEDCKRQVTGFRGTEYKGFPTRSEAEKYVEEFLKTSNSKQDTIHSEQAHSNQSELFEVAGFPGTEYKGFPTHSEAEKYVEEFLKTSNSKQDTIQSQQAHSDESKLFHVTRFPGNKGFPTYSEAEKHVEGFLKNSNPEQDFLSLHSDHSELFKSIEENGHQFMGFQSMASYDKYLDSTRQSANIKNCEGSKRVSTTWDHRIDKDDRGRDAQSGGVCQLEFNGASIGNPGKAGAGALLRCPHGYVVLEMMESVGIATNSVAEYRSLILGLKGALSEGVGKVRAQGDSKLVCMQVLGEWKVRKEHLTRLYNEVKELEKLFKEFSIMHVERELNSSADALANNAVYLEESESVREIIRPISKCCV